MGKGSSHQAWQSEHRPLNAHKGGSTDTTHGFFHPGSKAQAQTSMSCTHMCAIIMALEEKTKEGKDN